MPIFAVVVTGKEMRSEAPGKPIIGADGDRYWITIDEGWCSSARCWDIKEVPADVMTFDSAETATQFAIKWPGAPWWCSPKSGQHEIVELMPVFVPKFAGYVKISVANTSVRD